MWQTSLKSLENPTCKVGMGGTQNHMTREELKRMKMKNRGMWSVGLVALLVLMGAPGRVRAQRPAEWHDDLVDHLSGNWKVGGEVMGREAHHEVQAEWLLNHQFLRIHEQTAANAASDESKYEAFWFLGWDPVSEKYVMHLVDVFGGRFSETLGYGVRAGNEIRFVFEYPDGPFHTTMRWSAEKDSWEWVMEQKDKNGKWSSFADLKLSREK